jgi:hypothetical protein
VDVRDDVLGLARGADLRDDVSLGDGRAPSDEQRSEMRERGLVAVARRHGHGQTVRRNGAGERDLARSGRSDDAVLADGDVDTSMLAAGVRIVADAVRTQERTIDRPGPRKRRRRRAERPGKPDPDADEPPRCHSWEHAADGSESRPRGQRDLRSCYRELR